MFDNPHDDLHALHEGKISPDALQPSPSPQMMLSLILGSILAYTPARLTSGAYVAQSKGCRHPVFARYDNKVWCYDT
jgi:hypothetical protein